MFSEGFVAGGIGVYESRSSNLPDSEKGECQARASMPLGGISSLETETQKWVTELSPESKRLKGKMVCHRINLDTVARDLSTFTSAKFCIADTVEGRYFIRSFSLEILMVLPAAQNAYKVGILHRNLSAGNIMIIKDKRQRNARVERS